MGSTRENLVEVIIEENDSPHGSIEFNSTQLTVSESSTDEGFLHVIRRLGSFGDVRVRYDVIPGSATVNEDFTILTNEVSEESKYRKIQENNLLKV